MSTAAHALPISPAPEAAPDARQRWTRGSYEARVERFYEAGIGDDDNWHGGYRNFGWWTRGAAGYLDAADTLVREMGARLGLDAQSHLLDVACGGAPQDLLLHRETGARIDAVDATWAQVEQARRRVAAAGVGARVKIHHGSALELPFDPGTFTHALCIEGAQHFDTRADFFQRVAPLLRPGAVMVLADFTLARPPQSRWSRRVVREAQLRWNVPDANVQDEAAYQATLEAAGFSEVSFEGVGQHTIPGYYQDQLTPETARAHRRHKGWGWRFSMLFTNYFMYKAWEQGYLEYSIVRAVKA